MPALGQSGRIGAIDALRGIAAAMVMLAHLMPAADASALGPVFRALNWVFQQGQTGVLLFFLISGYVVPSSLLGHPDKHLRRFVISRVCRLYPAYWISVLLAALVLAEPLSLLQFTANLSLLQRFAGIPDMVGVYWTLQVEMVFYVLCILLFLGRVLDSPNRLGLLVVGLAAALLVAAALRRFTAIPLPVGWGLYILMMLFGTWLRLAAADSHRKWRAVLAFALMLAAICALLYYPTAFHRHWLSHYAGFVIALALFMALREVSWLSWNPLVRLGEISYSLYLFHSLMRPVRLMLWPQLQAWPLTAFAIEVGLSLAFSILVYKFVEQPAIRFGRRWADGSMRQCRFTA